MSLSTYTHRHIMFFLSREYLVRAQYECMSTKTQLYTDASEEYVTKGRSFLSNLLGISSSIKRERDRRGGIDVYELDEDDDEIDDVQTSGSIERLLGITLQRNGDVWIEKDQLYIRTSAYPSIMPQSCLRIVFMNRCFAILLFIVLLSVALNVWQ